MARRYVVIPSDSKLYEPDFKAPFMNMVAGMIWAIPFLQKVLPSLEELPETVS